MNPVQYLLFCLAPEEGQIALELLNASQCSPAGKKLQFNGFKTRRMKKEYKEYKRIKKWINSFNLHLSLCTQCLDSGFT